MDFAHKLICAMTAHDLHPDSLDLTPGKYHRFRSQGICKKKCCTYRIFDHYAGAHFLCWRRGISHIWFAKSKDQRFTAEQKRIIANEKQIAREKELKQKQKISANCAEFYYGLNPDPEYSITHPYCLIKTIFPYCARSHQETLVIPILNENLQITTLQFIYPNGFKKMVSGAPSKGGMIFLQKISPQYSGNIRICEGWATGCTVRELTNDPVVCAVNANNITQTAIFIRRNFIHAKGIICADNDRWGKENTGMKHAMESAKNTGFSVVFPQFSDNSPTHPTDFNDLFLISGGAEALSQLQAGTNP